MTHSRKAQAAMEFLMTYGWAIMVILVMIGALAYFGVFNAGDLLPEKCVFTTGFTCRDFTAYHNGGDLQVLFLLENGLGTSVRIVSAPSITVSGVSATCTNGSAFPITIGSGETRTFACTDVDNGLGAGTSLGVGQRVKASISLNYTEITGVFPHPVSGEIQTKIQ